MHGGPHGLRSLLRTLCLAVSLAALGALLFTGTSSAAPSEVSITAANDANQDATLSGSETIPAAATYPLTVSYQLTIVSGASPGPINGGHVIRSISDSNTTDLGTCA